MPERLDRAMLEAAFERLGRLSAEQERVIDIAVFGGCCLMLATDLRSSTRDVDAVFLTHADLAYTLGDHVADEMALPRDWLNQAVKSYAFARGNPEPTLLPFGEYPRVGAVGLRIFMPTPEFLLAMKLIANRDAPEDAARDLGDVLALMEITGLTTIAALHELLSACYPSVVSLGARLGARIADVVDQFARTRGDPNRQPPAWNAGRGDPVRER